jgi:phosphoribosylaminoimidazole-succinocarboxamide synthase
MLTSEELKSAIPGALQTVDLPGWGPKHAGKVRDMYQHQGKRILIATDRVSAFDRVLGMVPFKGQVLNLLSAWWFEQTRDIVPNHVLNVPDPNVTVAREAEPLPVEVVVRGYITGVTKTSLWYLYAQGERRPYGIPLPDGLQKNDALPTPIITPTTKATAGAHDERLTRDEILTRGLVSPGPRGDRREAGAGEALWRQVEEVSLALFARGQEVARRAGLILVDTKYEFGLIDERLALIDEIHTPDSSRFWTVESYQPGREPENLDKEYLRQWFADRGYRGDGEPPAMPADFIARVAARYLTAYERLTGRTFVPGEQPAAERIARNFRTLTNADEEAPGVLAS